MSPPRASRRTLVRAALLVPYMAAWAGSAYLPLPRTDLEIFFWPAADMGAAGQLLQAYAPGGQALYPDANGPLSLLPLTAVEWVARTAGWLRDDHLHKALTMVVFSLFLLLMAAGVVRAVERLRGTRLSEVQRLLTVGVVVLAPPAWQALAGFGHVEQPLEVLAVLIAAHAVASRRAVPAGIALGLAVLARSPAVLFGIPLCLALVEGRRWRKGLLMSAVAVATVGAVMTPFLLADRADVLHSLVFYRGALGVGAGSIWSLARDTEVGALAQHLDVVLAALLTVAISSWLALAPGGLRGARLFAALAAAAGTFALLGKAVWPYYFFEVYVFTAAWGLGRPGRLRTGLMAMAAVILMGLVAEVGSTNNLPDVQVRIEGTLMFVALGTFLAGLVTAARRDARATSG